MQTPLDFPESTVNNLVYILLNLFCIIKCIHVITQLDTHVFTNLNWALLLSWSMICFSTYWNALEIVPQSCIWTYLIPGSYSRVHFMAVPLLSFKRIPRAFIILASLNFVFSIPVPLSQGGKSQYLAINVDLRTICLKTFPLQNAFLELPFYHIHTDNVNITCFNQQIKWEATVKVLRNLR